MEVEEQQGGRGGVWRWRSSREVEEEEYGGG